MALPGGSICVIVIALYMIRWAHPFESEFNQRIRVIWVCRMITLLVMCLAPIFWESWNQGALFLIYVFSLALLLGLDFEGRERINHRHHEMKINRRTSLNSPSTKEHGGHGKPHGHGGRLDVAGGMANWESQPSKV